MSRILIEFPPDKIADIFAFGHARLIDPEKVSELLAHCSLNNRNALRTELEKLKTVEELRTQTAMKQKENDRLEAEFQKLDHEARRAEQRQNFAEAEQLVREALKLKPEDISIKARLEELIRREADAMVAAKNTEFQTLLKQAGDFLAQHKKQEAHECYKRALAIKPNDPQALEGLKQSEISVEK